MKPKDYGQMQSAIQEAIDVLKYRAHKNGYEDADEHKWVIAYLEAARDRRRKRGKEN